MASIYRWHFKKLPVFIQSQSPDIWAWVVSPPLLGLIQTWFRHKARDNILQEIFRTLPFPPHHFVNYCLCAILKYYSIMSLPPVPANQDGPFLSQLQWGSLSQVDSWGSEVSEVLPLSSWSWITWKEPPVRLWQILTTRRTIVPTMVWRTGSWYSPTWGSTSDLIRGEEPKLNCLMFTASGEMSEHLYRWPVTLSTRNEDIWVVPRLERVSQLISILIGRAWQVAWDVSHMWAWELTR